MGGEIIHRVGGLIAPVLATWQGESSRWPSSWRSGLLQSGGLRQALLESIEMAGHRDTRGHGIARDHCGENLLMTLHRVGDHLGSRRMVTTEPMRQTWLMGPITSRRR